MATEAKVTRCGWCRRPPCDYPTCDSVPCGLVVDRNLQRAVELEYERMFGPLPAALSRPTEPPATEEKTNG